MSAGRARTDAQSPAVLHMWKLNESTRRCIVSCAGMKTSSYCTWHISVDTSNTNYTRVPTEFTLQHKDRRSRMNEVHERTTTEREPDTAPKHGIP